ncbi:hypothetical protein NP493_143g03022 [Ridgeia piscesae]|uniref:Uncharacterized protein n=1 Tax=Ridgeia piscesae TaxID=27915 RepID=A0AAD9UG31_RIDPI|nr:hypothetical protein NP493_143g03022 [Ridgeia piscesae]
MLPQTDHVYGYDQPSDRPPSFNQESGRMSTNGPLTETRPSTQDPVSVVPIQPPAPSQQLPASTQRLRVAIVVEQASLENPPPDYFCAAMMVKWLCSPYCIGRVALRRSMECRIAASLGDRRLAEFKSRQTRDTVAIGFVVGLIIYIAVVGIIVYINSR